MATDSMKWIIDDILPNKVPAAGVEVIEKVFAGAIRV